MRTTQVKVKKNVPQARLPVFAHPEDACADIFACLGEPVVIESGETKVISTELVMDPGPDYEILVRSRSGLAAKGIVVANSPGTVDPNYRGAVGVILRNDSRLPYVVKDGAKIAQIAVRPIHRPDFVEVQELTGTERGAGGFGSTGL
jgi:dUTP pyrophosphatase